MGHKEQRKNKGIFGYANYANTNISDASKQIEIYESFPLTKPKLEGRKRIAVRRQ
jgi:hypothetical protein